MIQFIAPSDQTWIIRNLIERLPEDVSPAVWVFSYHDFYRIQKLHPGYLIFTGYGVLTDAERDAAMKIAENVKANPCIKIINRPDSYLNRYELLQALYEKGINEFRAFRIDEIDSANLTYPVFVREAGHHSGSLTDLLHDLESVKNAVQLLISQKYSAKNLLVVEYCHTADEKELFRKYSAQKIGDVILPRYLTLDYNWVVKEHSELPTDRVLYDRSKIEEEIQYIKENPHEEQIRDIFEMAGIEFGRIDYGFKDGRLQVWEINTLPTFGSHPDQKKKNQKRKKRDESKTLFYERMGNVTRSMLQESFIPEKITVKLSFNLRRRILSEHLKQKFMISVLSLGMKIPRNERFNKQRSKLKKLIKSLKY